MMSELDWESLLAIDGQQEEELRRFRAEQGLDSAAADPADPGPGQKETGLKTPSGAISLAPGIGFGRKSKPDEKRTSSKGTASRPGKWDAEALILDEDEESADDMDLLFYQLRKKNDWVSHDDKLEQKLRTVPDPVPEWTAETSAASLFQKYLSIAQQLSKGQITDSAQREMILLLSAGEKMDPGMKQFYSVFTLLQSGPSREHIGGVLEKADFCPARGESVEALRILCSAVRDAVRKQDAFDEAQDSRYRTRQGRLNAARGKAQSDYDSAKKEADRWRKGNE